MLFWSCSYNLCAQQINGNTFRQTWSLGKYLHMHRNYASLQLRAHSPWNSVNNELTVLSKSATCHIKMAGRNSSSSTASLWLKQRNQIQIWDRVAFLFNLRRALIFFCSRDFLFTLFSPFIENFVQTGVFLICPGIMDVFIAVIRSTNPEF